MQDADQVRVEARSAPADADINSMTIDLTGPDPRVVHACDGCLRLAPLYRLIGTSTALCLACFARRHG